MGSNISPRDSEAKLILSIVNNNILSKVKAKGVYASSLLHWGKVYEFVNDYSQRYGKMPNMETIYLGFPDFPVFSNNGVDPEFLIDLTIKNAKKKKLKETLSKAIDDLEDTNMNPDDIARQLKHDATDITVDIETSIKYLDEQTMDRYEEYLERRDIVAAGRSVGLNTGIISLDQEGVRLMEGDFVMLIGPPGSGKSFTLEKICITSHIQGKRILYICPEMTRKNVALRFDVMEGRYYGKIFSLEALRKGEPIDADVYLEWLEFIGERKNWIIVDSIDGGKFTVDKLESLVKEHSPDLVGIDSLTQFTTMSGTLAIGWIDVIEIANAIKTLATSTGKIFVAIGPTVGETFDSTEPAEMGEMGLSRGAVYKPDVILSLSKSLDPKIRHIKVIKMREGKETPMKLDFRFDADAGWIE